MTWCWPLERSRPRVPCHYPEPGRFMARRTHDIHTGIDLYCSENEAVLAVEDGVVVAVVPFTGPQADSPWWHDTQAVLVEGVSGVVCYGEVAASVEVGAQVATGQTVGRVLTVLKKDKGLPMTMLHLELYERGTKEPVWWTLDQDPPKNLLDPTHQLLDAARYAETNATIS